MPDQATGKKGSAFSSRKKSHMVVKDMAAKLIGNRNMIDGMGFTPVKEMAAKKVRRQHARAKRGSVQNTTSEMFPSIRGAQDGAHQRRVFDTYINPSVFNQTTVEKFIKTRLPQDHQMFLKTQHTKKFKAVKESHTSRNKTQSKTFGFKKQSETGDSILAKGQVLQIET